MKRNRTVAIAVLAVSVSFAGAAFVACSSFSGGSNAPSADAGSSDANPVDDASPPNDAPAPEDAAGDAQGSSLVATLVVAGSLHTCAVTASGLYCWGNNTDGQIGNGTTSMSEPVPVKVQDPTGPVGAPTQLVAGSYHTCALTGAGDVYCWGDNQYGECGETPGNPSFEPSPVQVQGLSNVVQLSAMRHATCALTQSGAVMCWGANEDGELATDGGSQSSTPQLVQGLPPIAALASQNGAATGECVIGADGGATWCWGENPNNFVGAPDASCTPSNVFAPTPVQNLPALTRLSAGTSHVCGILADGGALTCWGDDFSGELGNGVMGPSCVLPGTTPNALPSASSFGASSGFTCALSDGGVYCWGTNANGTLAIASDPSDAYLPTLVSSLPNATLLAVGAYHVCAQSDGHLSCWGLNVYGELGNGTKTMLDAGTSSFVLTPVPVTGF